MLTLPELENEFSRFIDFGKIFDKEVRTYIIHFLYLTLSRTQEFEELKKIEPEALADREYFRYLHLALEEITEDSKLKMLCSDNEELRRQVIRDILEWMRNTDKNISKEHPHETEKDMFDAWSHKPTHLWPDTWPILMNYLKNQYESHRLNTDFYAEKFKQVIPETRTLIESGGYDVQADKKFPVDFIISDLLAEWNALLTARRLKYELEKLREEQEAFTEKLLAKTDELEKLQDLIAPFAMELGRYWDMSVGVWKNTGFEVLEEYHEILQNEKGIRELADLLGNLREAEIETEEEEFNEVIVRKKRIKDIRLRSEIGGVRKSKDLNTMLPSEAALLANPETEMLFLQKFADESLMSFEYHGMRLISSNDVRTLSRQKQKRKEKGPFIICVDTSGSMHGMPAKIAKTLCFALIKIATRENRRCYLINFSVGLKTIDLLDISRSMDKIIRFLSMSFDGGTDAVPALSEALRMLQNHDYKEADVLMISDFVMYEIEEDMQEKMQRERSNDTAFHSLVISNRSNPVTLEAFDNQWYYDPESKDVVRVMLDDLKNLREF